MRSPIAKFLSEEELAAFRSEPATTVLFGADEPAMVARVLGALRLHLGRELELIDREALAVPLGDRLPAVRVGRGRASAGRPCTTRSRGRPTRRAS